MTLNMDMTRLSDDLLDVALRAAAEALIQSLQAMPGLQKAKIVIIGGYAVQHYVGTHRRTRDVDVLLFRPDRPIDPQWIRRELVSRFPTFFQESAQPLFFKYTEEDWIQVDIIPEYLPPYLPAHAMTVDEVDLDHLPFLDPLDLLAYKVHCSSMRPSLDKRRKDAMDTMWLWESIYGLWFVPLSDQQRHAIDSGLELMSEYSKLCRWRKMRMRRWVNM